MNCMCLRVNNLRMLARVWKETHVFLALMWDSSQLARMHVESNPCLNVRIHLNLYCEYICVKRILCRCSAHACIGAVRIKVYIDLYIGLYGSHIICWHRGLGVRLVYLFIVFAVRVNKERAYACEFRFNETGVLGCRSERVIDESGVLCVYRQRLLPFSWFVFRQRLFESENIISLSLSLFSWFIYVRKSVCWRVLCFGLVHILKKCINNVQVRYFSYIF